MTFTVAIIGRPNVGKSTLFNRLTGSRKALVDPRPGATRDRRESPAQIGPLSFTLIDTAGLEHAGKGSMEALMIAQTRAAIRDADLLLLVVDARVGLDTQDMHFMKEVRKSGKTVIFVANKCETPAVEKAAAAEFAPLGFGVPVCISAEHGTGLPVLAEAIARAMPKEEMEDEESDEDGEEEDTSSAIKIAIIGRPNVGKSTLLNQILGEERVIASPVAGTTRDAISVPFTFRGRDLELVDTAGMRRKSRIEDSLEQQSVSDALKTIRFAQVVILVLDAEIALDKQDLTLADHVIEEGRVLILALNKWDKVKDPQALLSDVYDRLERSFAQMRRVPTVTLSALTGHHVEKLLSTALEYYEKWNRRITTGQLNRWLEMAMEQKSPPLNKGREVRLRYATQSKGRPPTFLVFSSTSGDLPESYRRYLMHSLKEYFDLEGIPIRLLLRKKKNPYIEED